MKDFNFNQELFNTEMVIPDLDVHLGTRGPARFGLYSKRTPVRITDKNATMNLCSYLMLNDLLHSDKAWTLKVWKYSSTFYIAYTSTYIPGITIYVAKAGTGTEYIISAYADDHDCTEALSSTDIAKAIILFDICKDTDFADAVESSGTSLLETAYLLSDMYYFKYGVHPKRIVEGKLLKLIESVKWYKPCLLMDINKYKGELFVSEDESKEKSDTQKEAKRPKENAELFKKMQEGAYLLNYEWDMDSFESVRSLSTLKQFVPVPKFFRICQKIKFRTDRIMKRLNEGKEGVEAIGNDVININLIGRPGTGKSTLGEALSAVFGMPVGIVKNSDDTDSDEYEGRTCMVDGKPTFKYTDFTTIFENGGIILNEEVNLTPQGVVMGALGQAVIEPYTLKVNGYKNVQRHPLCIIVNLFNVGTVASKQLSQPFIGRFPNTYLLDDPTEEDMIKIMLSVGCDGVTVGTAKKIYNAYTRTLRYLRGPKVNDEDIALAVSMRHCIAACQDIEEGCSLEEALEETIIGVIAAYDLEVAENVRNDVIKVLPGI